MKKLYYIFGGSWGDRLYYARVDYCDWVTPYLRYRDIGLRLVRKR